MSTRHDEPQAGPDVPEPEGLRIEASRRQFLQFSGAATAAVSAVAAGGLFPSAAVADDTLDMRAGSNRPSWARTKYLVDTHVHIGSTPTIGKLAKNIQSNADKIALRTKDPAGFAKAMSEDGTDDSANLLQAMDNFGVTHCILQTLPNKGTHNQMVLDAAKNSKGRFIPLYRPEAIKDAAARGTLGVDYGGEISKVVRQVADELASPAMSATRGVGEMVPITTELHPIKISRDMAPIMEVLKARGNLPIQIPTGYSSWKGVHYYIYSPIWVDELAANFPTVPIVLMKMGRGIRASFDACLSIAMRNANIYFETCDTTPEHLREAINIIGAERIMFGSDLSGASVNYAIPDNLRTAIETRLTAEERDQIAWKTANQVYKLGLS